MKKEIYLNAWGNAQRVEHPEIFIGVNTYMSSPNLKLNLTFNGSITIVAEDNFGNRLNYNFDESRSGSDISLNLYVISSRPTSYKLTIIGDVTSFNDVNSQENTSWITSIQFNIKSPRVTSFTYYSDDYNGYNTDIFADGFNVENIAVHYGGTYFGDSVFYENFGKLNRVGKSQGTIDLNGSMGADSFDAYSAFLAQRNYKLLPIVE